MGWISHAGKDPVFLDKEELEIDKHLEGELDEIKLRIDLILSDYKLLLSEINQQLKEDLKSFNEEKKKKVMEGGFYNVRIKDAANIKRYLSHMQKVVESLLKHVKFMNELEGKGILINKQHNLIIKKLEGK